MPCHRELLNSLLCSPAILHYLVVLSDLFIAAKEQSNTGDALELRKAKPSAWEGRGGTSDITRPLQNSRISTLVAILFKFKLLFDSHYCSRHTEKSKNFFLVDFIIFLLCIIVSIVKVSRFLEIA